jgi:hypothetical protein
MLVSPVAVALKEARVFWFAEYLVAALAGARPTANKSAVADIAKNLFIILPDRQRLLPCSPKNLHPGVRQCVLRQVPNNLPVGQNLVEKRGIDAATQKKGAEESLSFAPQ